MVILIVSAKAILMALVTTMVVGLAITIVRRKKTASGISSHLVCDCSTLCYDVLTNR